MRLRNIIGTALILLGTAAIVFAIVMGLCVAVPRFAGFEPYAVVSGSMEPAIPVGSMAYVKACEPAYLEPGDIMGFFDRSGNVVIHRVVQNDTEAGEIVTKGDANEMPDPVPVSYQQAIGEVWRHVPFLGVPGMFGRTWMFVIVIAGLWVRLVGGMIRKRGQI